MRIVEKYIQQSMKTEYQVSFLQPPPQFAVDQLFEIASQPQQQLLNNSSKEDSSPQ
jgi:hypothetical protein